MSKDTIIPEWLILHIVTRSYLPYIIMMGEMSFFVLCNKIHWCKTSVLKLKIVRHGGDEK